MGCSLQGELVALRAKSSDSAAGYIGEVRLMAKTFPSENIRQVDLDKGYVNSKQGVAKSDAGMGVGGWIQNDKFDIVVARRMDSLQQLMLCTALIMV